MDEEGSQCWRSAPSSIPCVDTGSGHDTHHRTATVNPQLFAHSAESAEPEEPAELSQVVLVGHGSLHLSPCALEDYHDLSVSDYGQYDLVDGVLIFKPMGDTDHCNIAKYLVNLATERLRRGESALHASAAMRVAIPSKTKPTVRVPDVTVGNPLSARVAYPCENPPKVVVEITSHNRAADLGTGGGKINKMDEYAKAGVPLYVVIDRHINREGKKGHRPVVLVCELKNGSYTSQDYFQGQKIENEAFKAAFGPVSVAKLLHQANPDAVIVNNGKRERAELRKERARADKERARRKMEKDKKKERIGELKQQIRAMGVHVSDSSPSPPNSPGVTSSPPGKVRKKS